MVVTCVLFRSDLCVAVWVDRWNLRLDGDGRIDVWCVCAFVQNSFFSLTHTHPFPPFFFWCGLFSMVLARVSALCLVLGCSDPYIHKDLSKAEYQDIEHNNIPIAIPVEDYTSTVAAAQQSIAVYHHASAPPPQNPACTTTNKASTSTGTTTNNTTTMYLIHDNTTLGRNPVMMRICPHCNQESRTKIKTFPSWQSWTAAVLMLFLFWPLCWVPLVVEPCKQTDHYCVLCGKLVGTVNAFSDCCVTYKS